MIQNVLSSIGGVGNYGVISICLFVLVFTVVLVWSLTLKRPFLNTMESLPLDPQDSSSTPSPSTKGGLRHE
jgi:hypothetical protein